MKRTWMWGILAVLTAFIPYVGWAQPVATDAIISKNLLPDSLRNAVASIWTDDDGDILAAMSFNGIVRSRDNGATWERIFRRDFLTNFGFDVVRDKKTNALLYACGNGIFRSTDDGLSWIPVWQEQEPIVRCFLAKPDGSILAGMTQGIAQSDDGGATWRMIFSNSAKYFNVETIAINPKTGSIFAGVADTIGLGILRSVDDGKTWSQSNSGLQNPHVHSVASDSSGTIYAGTENGLYRSVNDGVLWARITEIGTTHKQAWKILVVKPDLVFVGFDEAGGLLKFDGKSWMQIVADSVGGVGSLAMRKESLLCGTRNAIYRVDGVITAVEDAPGGIPSSFRLEQNYPNPFNPSTTIQFSLPARTNVDLKIYNALGQVVETLISSEMESGTHQIVWNAGGYPSGVYFYRLETSGFIQAKRMLLVK